MLEPVDYSRWQEARLDRSSTYNFAPTDSFVSLAVKPDNMLCSTGWFGTTIYRDADTTQQLNDTIGQFESVFTDNGGVAAIPEDDWLQIPLNDDWRNTDAKLSHKVYPMGPKDREFIDETHDKLQRQGKMEWSKNPTPFAFPIFVVWRNVDGKRKGRVVVDIRGLNKVTMTDAYPMPLQTDITSAVVGCRYISTVDATGFFHQFRVRASDRAKLSVVTHWGREHYNVALMGFKNALAYAQRQINQILRDYGCNSFAKAFVDDIVVYSKTLNDHIHHLKTLFSALANKNVTLSGTKSYIGFLSVTLLGQRVDGLGLSTAEDKMAAIKALSFPATLKDLETYLGMTGWHRHFIPNYAQLAEPLQRRKTEGLKTAPTGGHTRQHFVSSARIEATPELLDAFNALQEAFSNPTMLVHYDKS